MMKTSTVQVRVDGEEKIKLASVAHRMRQTQSTILREAVNYIDQHFEDFMKWFFMDNDKEINSQE